MNNRVLKQLEISEANNRIGVLSIRSHTIIEAKVRNLTRGETERLHAAIDFIEGKLKGRADDQFRAGFTEALKSTAFLASDSPDISARAAQWWHDLSIPVIYLNRAVYMASLEDLALTVLHELIHQMEGFNGNGMPDDSSAEEARHDLKCYALLDLPVEPSRWIFKERPELLKEFPDLSIGKAKKIARPRNQRPCPYAVRGPHPFLPRSA